MPWSGYFVCTLMGTCVPDLLESVHAEKGFGIVEPSDDFLWLVTGTMAFNTDCSSGVFERYDCSSAVSGGNILNNEVISFKLWKLAFGLIFCVGRIENLNQQLSNDYLCEHLS